MRKTLPFILALLLLAACTTQPAAPTSTATTSPPPKDTAIPTEMPTATVVVTTTPVEPMILSESELFNESYRTGELSTEILPGVTALTEIVTDKSGCPVACRVEVNPSWNDAENAIPRFTWKLLFEVGKHTGGAEGSGFAKDMDADAYAKMVAEAKAGNLDWSQLGIGLKQIYLAGSETPQDVTIVPMSGDAALPEGMRAVNKVVWVMGGEFPMENMTETNRGNGTAKAVLSGDTLYLYIGANDSVDKDIRGIGVKYPGLMSQMVDFLWKATGMVASREDLAGMLRKKSGFAAITVYDVSGQQGETEKATNHP